MRRRTVAIYYVNGVGSHRLVGYRSTMRAARAFVKKTFGFGISSPYFRFVREGLLPGAGTGPEKS